MLNGYTEILDLTKAVFLHFNSMSLIRAVGVRKNLQMIGEKAI